MTQLTVYHVSKTYLGKRACLSPKIPSSKVYGEDAAIPRISVCSTIPMCIYAMPDMPDENFENKTKLYVYKSKIALDNLAFPSVDQVPDVWKTGEMWILNDWIFDLHQVLEVSCQAHICNTVYSRFQFHDIMADPDYEDLVLDFATGSIVYGESASFSMLMLDNRYMSLDDPKHLQGVQFADHPGWDDL